MKGIVIYKGKYGATAQYAGWVAEALHLPVIDINQQNAIDIMGYDYVIVGSPVYMGKLLIRDWLTKNEEMFLNKKLFLFVVSSTSPDDKSRQETVLKGNLSEKLADATTVFFLRGRVVINKLSWTDKLIVWFGAMREKDPQKKALMRRGFDAVKRENINPLIKTTLHFSNSEDVYI
ncbi:MAG TPA: flavodoxin domain-containing protein [Mucilaginibacter sp.]|jgi:menaquinone-dependent protoporphyrinogen IX oxidase|nr:flavodoxin domain-containing protein [Mucilaginibacter sp.]